jgi:hypothetical protein
MKKEEMQTKVTLDMRGYACAGGDQISRNGYLWIGTDDPVSCCYTHTTSLRSLRGLRDLCDALIKARTAPRKKRKSK